MNSIDVDILTVLVEDRNDGGLRVRSDDLPGLGISGADKQRVLELIAPTIKRLLESQGLKRVQVQPVNKTLRDVLRKPSPREMDLSISSDLVHPNLNLETAKRYVVKFASVP